MGIYESLWSLDRGSIGGETEDSRLLGDAWLGARIVRVYARDWLVGASRFTALVLHYLVEDQNALGPADARRVGLVPDDLAYIGTAMTANGQVRTAPVTLDEIAIGDIVDRNVRAWVIGADLDGSLLGMSYLRTFARVSFEGDLLILER